MSTNPTDKTDTTNDPKDPKDISPILESPPAGDPKKPAPTEPQETTQQQ